MLKVLGVIALIWIGFMVLGALFEFIFWALVIGAVVFVGAAAYTALSDRSNRRAIR